MIGRSSLKIPIIAVTANTFAEKVQTNKSHRTVWQIARNAVGFCLHIMVFTEIRSSAQPCLQVQNLLFNKADGFQEFFIRLAGGVFQTPVLPPPAGKEGALDITAHGDHHIHRRKIRKQFAVLAFFHVNAVDLFHQADRIRAGPAGI